MNWHKRANTDVEILKSFVNWLEDFSHRANRLASELSMLDWLGEDTPRWSMILENANSLFGEAQAKYRSLKSINESFYNYYLKDEKKKEKIFDLIKKLESLILEASKHYRNGLEERELIKYHTRIASDKLKLAANFASSLKILLLNDLFYENDLMEKITIQEFSQFNLDDEPSYKEVGKSDGPSWGKGWKAVDPSTGEWKWWKTNWDSSG